MADHYCCATNYDPLILHSLDGWSLLLRNKLWSSYTPFSRFIFIIIIFKFIINLLLFLWRYYLSFGIPVACTNILSICMAVEFLGSSRIFTEVAFVIFSAILLPTRSPVPSAAYWIALYDAVLRAANFFVLLRSFCLCLMLKLLLMYFAKVKHS